MSEWTCGQKCPLFDHPQFMGPAAGRCWFTGSAYFVLEGEGCRYAASLETIVQHCALLREAISPEVEGK